MGKGAYTRTPLVNTVKLLQVPTTRISTITLELAPPPPNSQSLDKKHKTVKWHGRGCTILRVKVVLLNCFNFDIDGERPNLVSFVRQVVKCLRSHVRLMSVKTSSEQRLVHQQQGLV